MVNEDGHRIDSHRINEDNVTESGAHGTGADEITTHETTTHELHGEAQDYEPIDCTIHDQLIERAAFRLPTEVKYHDENGELVVARDMIEDVFSRRGAEYLRLSSGTEIRLDKIVDFGGTDSGG